jgi:hypothetical protein
VANIVRARRVDRDGWPGALGEVVGDTGEGGGQRPHHGEVGLVLGQRGQPEDHAEQPAEVVRVVDDLPPRQRALATGVHQVEAGPPGAEAAGDVGRRSVLHVTSMTGYDAATLPIRCIDWLAVVNGGSVRAGRIAA